MAAAGYVTKDGPYNAEYEHLEKIINRVISDQPKDAYGLVEVLSRLVREQVDTPVPTATEDIQAAAEYVKKVRKLDQAPAEGEPPAPKPVASAITDFCEEADMLQWAGVGFGDLESYKIKCALRNLADAKAEQGFATIRLWGKILGSEADYYIAEAFKEGGEPDEGEDPEANPDAEFGGTGVNKFTYYATTDLASQEWIKLPNIKPAEIIAARRIKKLMSGKPDAKVVTHPPFPGTEKVLLRAQIARITADVTLMFKDKLVREGEFGTEDAGEVQPPEEWKMPPMSELLTLKGWQHCEPHILRVGRTTHAPITLEPDEENPDAPVNKQIKRIQAEMEADPARDPIRRLENDGLQWVIKQYGDDALYKSTSTDPAKQEPTSNAVVCIRSLTWPGAVSVAQGPTMVQLYTGYGMAAKEPDFFPHALPDIQDEPEDPGEQVEPQGTNEAPPAEEES